MKAFFMVRNWTQTKSHLEPTFHGGNLTQSDSFEDFEAS
jgi:hypothetical protein